MAELEDRGPGADKSSLEDHLDRNSDLKDAALNKPEPGKDKPTDDAAKSGG